MITIDEEKFNDVLAETTVDFAKDGVDISILTSFCVAIKLRLYDCKKSSVIKNDAPFKSGDAVFVIDNKSDANNFVNQVVTVLKVRNDYCDVTDGECAQAIYFKNLRKVKTS